MATAPNLDLLLLARLATGPMHGYGLIVSLREESSGEFDYPEGTVYPALHRLESEGLVTSSSSRFEGRVRRVYQLTPKGRIATADRVLSWRRYVNAVETLLAAPAVSTT
jgi:DNA-binding PadR family transcriptional regulator